MQTRFTNPITTLNTMTTRKLIAKKSSTTPEVLLERFPYRYVTKGNLEINGKPDCRIQKWNETTKRWYDIYLCDNEMQLTTAMEDFDYTLWLDGQYCYVS